MRCAPLWTLALVLGFATSAWAQFGGGGLGGGGGFNGGLGGDGFGAGMSPPGMGGFEMGGTQAQEGINAFRDAPANAAPMQVIWGGPNAEASQKLATRLRTEETKIQFVDTPLTEVIGYLQKLHHVPIQLDRAVLKRDGFDPEMKLSVEIESLVLPVALDLLTKQHGLGWYVEGGALVLTSYDEADLRMSPRIYKLSQLDAAGAAKVLTKVVFPSSWSEQGGEANLAVIRDRNVLVIRQNREGHEAVESLLTQLEQLK